MKRTILLVEDDSSTLRALTVFLEREYRVISARNGVEAIIVYEQHEKDISAVLTDWNMPRLNGDDLITWLRAKDPNLPVILISAHGLEKIRAEGFVPPSEGFEYIQKPFNLPELSKKMEQVIGNAKADQFKLFPLHQKEGVQRLATPLHEHLYREFMGRCLAIDEAMGKYDLFLDDIPLEEWKQLKQQFWNEYVYPKFEEIYFQLFPNDRNDPARFKGELSILEYNMKIDIALCTWFKRDGFFHLFKDETFFINPDPTDMAFILTNGALFRPCSYEQFGNILERAAGEGVENRKKMERLVAWVGGLSLLAGILVGILIAIIIWVAFVSP